MAKENNPSNYSHEDKAMQDLERELAEVKKSLEALDLLHVEKKQKAAPVREQAPKQATPEKEKVMTEIPAVQAEEETSDLPSLRKQHVKELKTRYHQEADTILKGRSAAIHSFLDQINQERQEEFKRFLASLSDSRKERENFFSEFKKMCSEEKNQRQTWLQTMKADSQKNNKDFLKNLRTESKEAQKKRMADLENIRAELNTLFKK